MKMAPDDTARLQSYMIPPQNMRDSASFTNYRTSLNQNQDRATLTHINPANYDGTFVPSNSVRTVEPPDGIMPWAIEPIDPPAHFPEPTPPVEPPASNWVPANAKIHIDFVGGSPQGRAWTEVNGEVAIDTLVGHDPNTENGWGVTGYDPAALTENGYSTINEVLPNIALIGTACSMMLAGATFRMQWVQLIAGVQYPQLAIAVVSADGNDAIEFDAYGSSQKLQVSSWNGSLNSQIFGGINVSVGSLNIIAGTLTNNRCDCAVNGSTAVAGVIDETDRPSSNPLVAIALADGGTQNAALQSITLYDPLPDTTGLSELSMISGGGTAPEWVPANAKIHIDFLGGTPQGRAWTEVNGEVAIDTLLGSDPNTENAWDATGYNSSNITADGYVCLTIAPAFIGSALSKIITGSTVRYVLKQMTTATGAHDLLLVSADGNDALNVSQSGLSFQLYTWGGNTSAFHTDLLNSIGAINGIAITIAGMRMEGAANGQAAIALTLVDLDRPATNPMVAALLDPNVGTPNTQAIQSITIYDPLPTTAGLSELSEI